MATVPSWPNGGGGGGLSTNESVPSVSNSDGTNDSETGGDDDGTNDAEGVWSPDIEQSFQEALAIYPPCGRRKIILSDEGKMYGRNELIARYIKLRTGKTRTRKQVSSHIQVLARRKSKDIQNQLKSCPSATAKERALQSLSAMSSSQIVSVSAMRTGGLPPVSMPVSSTAGGVDHLSPHDPMGFHNTITSQAMRWPTPAVPSALDLQGYGMYGGLVNPDIKPQLPIPGVHPDLGSSSRPPAWEGRSIAGPLLRLTYFTSFLTIKQEQNGKEHPPSGHPQKRDEKLHMFVDLGPPPGYSDPLLETVDVKQIYDKFPTCKGGLQDLYDRGPNGAFYLVKFWADLNTDVAEDTPGTFYGVTSRYESREQMSISCSTKVCSFGKQVVEKVETEHARYENGRFVYNFDRSPMCEYMVTFIHKLKQLPEKYMMNSVLENFTILQVVSNRDTQETLLCICFVFEVTTSESGCQHSIFRLTKE